MSSLWKGIYIFLFGSLLVLALTRSAGFATVAGSLFSGLNGLGSTLTGAGIKNNNGA
jgi:hypothetical protein